MKKIDTFFRLCFFILVLLAEPGHAQDTQESDSLFTQMVLDRKNAYAFRMAPALTLTYDHVAKELGLSQEQRSAIAKVNSTAEKELAFWTKKLKEGAEVEGWLDEIRAGRKATNERWINGLYSALSHAQRKRFAQISFQKFVGSSNSLEMYLHPRLRTFIPLTVEQRSFAQDAIEQSNVDYLDELAQLNEKIRQQVLSEVNTTIRDKIDPVVGSLCLVARKVRLSPRTRLAVIPDPRTSRKLPAYPTSMDIVFGLLDQSILQKELELDKDQVADLKPLIRKYPSDFRKRVMSVKLASVIDESKVQDSMEQHSLERAEVKEKLDDEYTEKLGDILLPFQQERLSQIALQLLHAKPMFVSVFAEDIVAERAELSDSQAESLRKAAIKAEKNYLAELRALKMKHHRKVRQSFSPEVREMVQEVLGDPFFADPKLPDRSKR